MNFVLCSSLRLGRREFKAVLLMSSQKTLPVSVTVISFLGALGEEGLMTIPCIVGHMSQLFIDAYISSRWAAEPQMDVPVATVSISPEHLQPENGNGPSKQATV